MSDWASCCTWPVHVLVADLVPLRVHDIESELLGREVDACLARLAVGVVLVIVQMFLPSPSPSLM